MPDTPIVYTQQQSPAQPGSTTTTMQRMASAISPALGAASLTLWGMAVFGRGGAILAPLVGQAAMYAMTPANQRPSVLQPIVTGGLQAVAAGVGNTVAPNNDWAPAVSTGAVALLSNYITKPTPMAPVAGAAMRQRRVSGNRDGNKTRNDKVKHRNADHQYRCNFSRRNRKRLERYKQLEAEYRCKYCNR